MSSRDSSASKHPTVIWESARYGYPHAPCVGGKCSVCYPAWLLLLLLVPRAGIGSAISFLVMSVACCGGSSSRARWRSTPASTDRHVRLDDWLLAHEGVKGLIDRTSPLTLQPLSMCAL